MEAVETTGPNPACIRTTLMGLKLPLRSDSDEPITWAPRLLLR